MLITALRHICWLLMLLIAAPLYAFHAEVNLLHKKQTPEFSALYFQQTSAVLTVDDLRSDPAHYHAFIQRTKNTPFLLAGNPDYSKAIWLFARLKNTDTTSQELVISYPFSQAERIEIYQVSRDNQNISLLTRSGSQFPYSRRDLPYRSYSVPLTLQPQQIADIYIRIQNSTLTPVTAELAHYSDFVITQQHQLLADLILPVLLLLAAGCCLCWYFRLKQRYYLLLSIFFASLMLVILEATSLGFALLWPYKPEINQAVLYIFSGAVLLSLSLLPSHLSQKTAWPWQILRFSQLLLALALLFSPLYTDNPLRTLLLAGSCLWILSGSAILAFYKAFRQHDRSYRQLIWPVLLCICITAWLLSSQLMFAPAKIQYSLLVLSSLLTMLTLYECILPASQNSSNHQPTEPALPFSPHYYHELFHTAAEGLFTTTLDGRLINANPALLQILGYQQLEQMKQDVAASGMSRFYAYAEERQQMLQQLQHYNNTSFEFRALRADGSPFWAMMSARLSAQAIDNTTTCIHGSVIDVTPQKLATEKLAYLANHDPLTALHNRVYFEQQIQHGCDNISRQPYSLLYIDIDQFRLINNSCSHTAGDALLRQFAEHLKHILGPSGTLARLDSDEFGVLLPARNADAAFALAYQLLESVKNFRFSWHDNVYNITISIGVTELSVQDMSADSVIRKADSACMIAKEQGRNRIHLFDEGSQEAMLHRAELQWVNQLRQAIQEDRFELYQQTIQAVRQPAQKLHYELLLRLRDKEDNLVIPDSFIRSAERYGLMPQIDRWVIKHYFLWLQQHPAHMQQLDMCCINVSGSSLTDLMFKDDVQTLFLEYQIPYHKICFEITESVAILNLQNTLNFIEHFRRQGCRFALDDFGSGFSSYGYLKHFPADFVKIDGSFIRDLLGDHYNKAIIKSIHEVAKAMNMLTIAEFVENTAILTELRLMGIDYVQGYAISPPQPLT